MVDVRSVARDPSRNAVRAVLAAVVLVAATGLAAGYVTSPAGDARFAGKSAAEISADAGPGTVPPRDGVTVVTTDSNSWLGERSDGPRARAEIVAFAPNGSVLYYDDAHTRYWDIDPAPTGEYTVDYLASDHLPAGDCAGDSACTRNLIERVNLTTGESEVLYANVTPGKHSTRYHDADRIGPGEWLVADIAEDRVFVVDAAEGRTTWVWDAEAAVSRSSGGPYPDDWTHLNDVEALADGRFVVSLRNQDQVVFLNRSTGVIPNWTLGADGDHGVLYEQHNPDYLPPEADGPAVIAADSENGRVVEYQREDGNWTRTWQWRDVRLQWPRDADRLPNGHTLITDSNGNRVLEVDRGGDVVWSATIAFPYEAERLGTGDESAGGPSAARTGLDSFEGGPGARFWLWLKELVPDKYLNGVMYVTPVWVGLPELFALAVLVLAGLAWAGLELYWRSRRPSPA